MRLVWESFRHAQGEDRYLHPKILEYLKWRFPELTITDDQMTRLRSSMLTKFRPLLENGKRHQPRSTMAVFSDWANVEENTNVAFKQLRQGWSGEKRQVFEGALDTNGVYQITRCTEFHTADSYAALPADLAFMIARQDRKFLSRPEGRVRIDPATGATVSLHHSHLIHYGLEHHPTGMAEFDRMYAEITDTVTQALSSPGDALTTAYGTFTSEDLNQLSSLHHHPY